MTLSGLIQSLTAHSSRDEQRQTGRQTDEKKKEKQYKQQFSPTAKTQSGLNSIQDVMVLVYKRDLSIIIL